MLESTAHCFTAPLVGCISYITSFVKPKYIAVLKVFNRVLSNIATIANKQTPTVSISIMDALYVYYSVFSYTSAIIIQFRHPNQYPQWL
jgi:hypothetical protein